MMTGERGEFFVDKHLTESDWKRLGPLGGQQRGLDGLYEHPSGAKIAVAIRARQDAAQFDDLKPQAAEALKTRAEKGGAQGLFVALAVTGGDVDWSAGSADPGQIVAIRACTFEQSQKIAQRNREAYAAELYVRGEKRGQPRDQSGCRYAIGMDDLDPFDDVLAEIVEAADANPTPPEASE